MCTPETPCGMLTVDSGSVRDAEQWDLRLARLRCMGCGHSYWIGERPEDRGWTPQANLGRRCVRCGELLPPTVKLGKVPSQLKCTGCRVQKRLVKPADVD